MASKAFSKSLLPLYRFFLRRLTNPLFFQRRSSHASHVKFQRSCPPLDELSSKTLVFDVEGGLLRSSSTFPYFMLVALEAGGYLRGLLLLFLYPFLLCLLSQEAALRAVIMVCFCGLRVESFRVGRAVLPKFFLEDVGLEGFEVLRRGGKRVCVTCMPRVMVEWFLKEYMEVEVVLGRELKVFGGFYSGLMEEVGMVIKYAGGGEVVAFGSCSKSLHHVCFSHCKEVYLVSQAEKKGWRPLPRGRYPKPLVFHDGRLAFRPTPLATLAMFAWLPLGFPLSIFRMLVFLLLPYDMSIPIGALTGMKSRVISSNTSTVPTAEERRRRKSTSGHLYVCNHRTLLDPIYISASLNKQVTAVTYSLSPFTELIAPIRTVRLTRNKDNDRNKMAKLLQEGDIVVCPEGTTCREPYILRFSPLFAELTDWVIPVALITRVTMFYGTTASGVKALDPLYLLMNPWPEYDIEFLEKISTASGQSSSYEAANRVQRELGKVLQFECTALTRKDKYLMLAGNEGIVATEPKKQ